MERLILDVVYWWAVGCIAVFVGLTWRGYIR